MGVERIQVSGSGRLNEQLIRLYWGKHYDVKKYFWLILTTLWYLRVNQEGVNEDELVQEIFKQEILCKVVEDLVGELN